MRDYILFISSHFLVVAILGMFDAKACAANMVKVAYLEGTSELGIPALTNCLACLRVLCL